MVVSPLLWLVAKLEVLAPAIPTFPERWYGKLYGKGARTFNFATNRSTRFLQVLQILVLIMKMIPNRHRTNSRARAMNLTKRRPKMRMEWEKILLKNRHQTFRCYCAKRLLRRGRQKSMCVRCCRCVFALFRDWQFLEPEFGGLTRSRAHKTVKKRTVFGEFDVFGSGIWRPHEE